MLFFSFLTIISGVYSQQESAVLRMYKEADLVFRVRIAATSLSETPYFTHDLGTEWYSFHFSIVHKYKQRTSSADSNFLLPHFYNAPPISDSIKPGKEYIVFLKADRPADGYSNQPSDFSGYQVILKDGLVMYSDTWDKKLKGLLKETSFDRAVYACYWKAVRRKIHSIIRKEAFVHGRNTNTSMQHLNSWLASHQTVDALHGDSCGIHIDIYPGWVDEGIRFLTSSGPIEKQMTIGLGKVRKWGFLYHWVGLHSSCDKLIFRGLWDSPGVLEAFRKNCLDFRFQRISNWKSQKDIEISTVHFYDTITPVSMTSPLIRIKVKLLNRSAGPLNVLWPDKQDDGWEIFLFRMLEKEGGFCKEDGEFLEMPPLTSIGPSMVRLMPGDSLVGWHSFNDPFCCDTDPTACHDLSALTEGDWKTGLVYKPMISAGDTSVYWNPEGGSRILWNNRSIHINSVKEAKQMTVRARLLEKTGDYLNYHGQRGRYDALVAVIEVPGDCPFKQGDTIACRFPVNIHYLLRLAESRPAMNAELMTAGDMLEIDFLANYPPDEFNLKSGQSIKNYLLLNSMNTLRFIER